jgi:hypothetical protein
MVLISAGWLIVTQHFGPRFGVGNAGNLMKVAAGVLGVQAAWLVSEDIDPPADLIGSTPLGYWRLPAVRLALWSMLCVGGLWATIGQWPTALPGGTLFSTAAVLVLASGIALLLAACAGSHTGGGLAIAVLSAGGVIAAGLHQATSAGPRAGMSAQASVSPNLLSGAWREALVGIVLILVSLARVASVSPRRRRLELPFGSARRRRSSEGKRPTHRARGRGTSHTVRTPTGTAKGGWMAL